MFVIMVYDVNTKRGDKALKVGRRYMTWVQNSVFEGELTPGKLRSMKSDMAEVIDPESDSVMFYTLGDGRYTSRDFMGVERVSAGNLI